MTAYNKYLKMYPVILWILSSLFKGIINSGCVVNTERKIKVLLFKKGVFRQKFDLVNFYFHRMLEQNLEQRTKKEASDNLQSRRRLDMNIYGGAWVWD